MGVYLFLCHLSVIYAVFLFTFYSSVVHVLVSIIAVIFEIFTAVFERPMRNMSSVTDLETNHSLRCEV